MIVLQALNFQRAYKKSMAEEEIAQMQRQLDEINDWRQSFLSQQIDERIAAFVSEHGTMPGSCGGGGGDDDADDDADDDDE